jgi:hypothetical protein
VFYVFCGMSAVGTVAAIVMNVPKIKKSNAWRVKWDYGFVLERTRKSLIINVLLLFNKWNRQINSIIYTNISFFFNNKKKSSKWHFSKESTKNINPIYTLRFNIQ